MTLLVHTEGATFVQAGMSPVRDVSLSVSAGELCVIAGARGAGKSTLLRGLLGLADLEGGRAELFGKDLSGLSHAEWMPLRSRCAYASWTAPLVSNLTLLDNLTVPLLMRSQPEDTARGQVHAALERFGLSALASTRPHDLLGDAHRLALVARALLIQAELLFIDDPPEHSSVEDALRDAATQGAAVLVTARRAERFAAARHVLVSPGRSDVDAVTSAVR